MITASTKTTSDEYNPYPNFVYSGKLRPYPLSDKREVPTSIRRPDYADHPNGKSLCEEKERGTANNFLKILMIHITSFIKLNFRKHNNQSFK